MMIMSSCVIFILQGTHTHQGILHKLSVQTNVYSETQTVVYVILVSQ